MTHQEFQEQLENLVENAPKDIKALILVKNEFHFSNVLIGSPLEIATLITLAGFKTPIIKEVVKVANKGLKSDYLKNELKK